MAGRKQKCRGCEEAAVKIAELERRLIELEEKLAKSEKNSSNSSKPPSSDIVNQTRVKRRQPKSRGRNARKVASRVTPDTSGFLSRMIKSTPFGSFDFTTALAVEESWKTTRRWNLRSFSTSNLWGFPSRWQSISVLGSDALSVTKFTTLPGLRIWLRNGARIRPALT